MAGEGVGRAYISGRKASVGSLRGGGCGLFVYGVLLKWEAHSCSLLHPDALMDQQGAVNFSGLLSNSDHRVRFSSFAFIGILLEDSHCFSLDWGYSGRLSPGAVSVPRVGVRRNAQSSGETIDAPGPVLTGEHRWPPAALSCP